ncbi:MAG: S9 family peptidase [Nitrospiraceae bacterium]|nr:MAG: S9 family peptidase [Nitrospiraceae bacterium]
MKLQKLVFVSILLTVTAALAQENAIAPGENLVVEGIPPVPASLVETVGRYTEFRRAAFLSWHPTKREMLIRTRFAETPQIHRVQAPGGARAQLTFFTDATRGAAYPPKGGDWFVFAKDSAGNEFYQLYRYDLASGASTLLTDGNSRNSNAVWSNNGDRLVYSSTRRNGKDTDLYVVNPADPHSDQLLAKLEGSGWRALDWSPDDRTLLMLEFISINESHLWRLGAATGEKILLTPKNGPEPVSYGGGRFSKDGKGLYVTTDRGSEFHRLAHIDLATMLHTYLTDAIVWGVEDFDLSRDGKRLAFVTNEDGVGVLHIMDVTTGQLQAAPKFPVGIISGLQWHANGTDLGLTVESVRSPADAYSFNLATGTVERWTHSETGGLNSDSFPEPELVRWKSFDGRTLSGFLYLPPSRFAGRRPVAMSIHGGPESQARPQFLARHNYWLNELGVALLYPNVRGSTGYGKTFLKLDNGLLREDAYKDIGALLDWIATRPELDAGRVMVFGTSYGGHMALAVGTRYADRICCLLDIVGISNIVTFLQNTEAYRQSLRRVEYGDERDPTMRAFLDRIAPVNNADKLKKPLFVVQGKNDPRVPLSEAEQMVATARRNGAPVWYLMARDEGHGFAKKKNADFLFYATILFMQEYLLR